MTLQTTTIPQPNDTTNDDQAGHLSGTQCSYQTLQTNPATISLC